MSTPKSIGSPEFEKELDTVSKLYDFFGKSVKITRGDGRWTSYEAEDVVGYIRGLYQADIDRAEREARLSEITGAWENSCMHSSAPAISLSLAQRRRYLEDELATLSQNEDNN